jgi:BirA family biotin operon repressor/biotin-[acetyl-CoA-carboxylase] ligase
LAGWTLLEYEVVSSTNFVAAGLPAWHAVRAATQTAGRGRFSRSWISDAGGLWLSAVIPTGPDDRWRTLPLVAGLSVIDSLRELGVAHARLRWPNDIMVNNKKLAGLLVDSFSPGLAVIGIGVNVTNHPESHDASLKNITTTLADLVPGSASTATLTAVILKSLRSAVDHLADSGFGPLESRINQMWGGPRRVILDLDGVHRFGLFTGVDDAGRLVLRDDAQRLSTFEPHQVRLLREV